MSPYAPKWTSPVRATTVEEARCNLTKALELFFETADASEVQRRLQSEVFITHLEVAVG